MNEKNSIQGTNVGTKSEGLVDQAKHAVENVVGNVAGQARSQVTTEVTAQKTKAVDTMTGVADALRQTSDGMKDAGPLPMLADQAADTVERVATYLQSKTLGDLIGEVERFARREPAIFLGGAFAAGLLGGRFLKSSAPTRSGGDIDRFDYASDYDREEPARFAPRRMAPALPPLAPPRAPSTSTNMGMGTSTGTRDVDAGATTTPMNAIKPPTTSFTPSATNKDMSSTGRTLPGNGSTPGNGATPGNGSTPGGGTGNRS
ncbi:MAG: hypothetical protein JWM74_4255 [Myxococcaceae bacterium]|nr:hypothetical protein [Myxococcaceae bacterium]